MNQNNNKYDFNSQIGLNQYLRDNKGKYKLTKNGDKWVVMETVTNVRGIAGDRPNEFLSQKASIFYNNQMPPKDIYTLPTPPSEPYVSDAIRYRAEEGGFPHTNELPYDFSNNDNLYFPDSQKEEPDTLGYGGKIHSRKYKKHYKKSRRSYKKSRKSNKKSRKTRK